MQRDQFKEKEKNYKMTYMFKIRYFIYVLCFKNFLWTTLYNIFISTPILND